MLTGKECDGCGRVLLRGIVRVRTDAGWRSLCLKCRRNPVEWQVCPKCYNMDGGCPFCGTGLIKALERP